MTKKPVYLVFKLDDQQSAEVADFVFTSSGWSLWSNLVMGLLFSWRQVRTYLKLIPLLIHFPRQIVGGKWVSG